MFKDIVKVRYLDEGFLVSRQILFTGCDNTETKKSKILFLEELNTYTANHKSEKK